MLETCYDDRYYLTLHFDTSLRHLDFDSKSQGIEKAHISALIISQICRFIQLEFIVLLGLHFSRPINIRGSE